MPRLSHNGSLVKYQDHVPTHGQSPIPVLTSAHVEQHNMLPLIQTAAAHNLSQKSKDRCDVYTDNVQEKH